MPMQVARRWSGNGVVGPTLELGDASQDAWGLWRLPETGEEHIGRLLEMEVCKISNVTKSSWVELRENDSPKTTGAQEELHVPAQL